MPTYFSLFLLTLGVSALLFVAALIAAGITRRPPPALVPGRAADGLRLLQLALVWSNVGVAWLLFFNVYPMHVDMARLGDAALQAYTRAYTTRLPIVVLPFGAGALAAALGLWAAPGRFTRRAPWGIATLWMLSLVSTPWAAGALGDFHDHGFTDAAFQQLQLAHLARSLCVSVAAVWALLQLARSPA